MNLTNLRDQVKAHGFSDQTDTTLDRWINDSYFHIVGSQNWPFLEKDPVTINFSATNPVATNTPADLGKVVSITGSGTKLSFISRDDFLSRLSSATDADGTPKYYTVWNSKIRVLPAPSGTPSYTLWYLQDPAVLSSGSDVPLLPERYHHLIVVGALIRAYTEFDDNESLGQQQQRFDQLMQQMVQDVMDVEIDKKELIGDPYTLAAMRQELRDHGFSEFGDSVLTTFINDSISDICSRFDWTWLRKGPVSVATTASSSVIDMPDNFQRMESLFNENGYKLTYLEPQEFADVSSYDRNSIGYPEYYTIYGFTNDEDTANESTTAGQKVMLWPAPSTSVNYEAWYIKTPAKLSTINDKPELPNEYRDLVIKGALLRCSSMSQDEKLMSKAAGWKSDFEERIDRMREDNLRTQNDRPKFMENVYGQEDW